jgi:hypothetical protein
MVKLSDYFVKHGVNDAPRGVLYYKALGCLTFVGTVGMCYRYQPTVKMLMWSVRQYQGPVTIISFKGLVQMYSKNIKQAPSYLKEIVFQAKQKYPEAFGRTQETFEQLSLKAKQYYPEITKATVSGAELGGASKIGNLFGTNYHKFALAFAIVEGTVLYKLSSPITIPFKFWIVSRMLRNYDQELNWQTSIEDIIGVILSAKE